MTSGGVVATRDSIVAEMLDEMEFMRWCDDSCWPQAVAIWIRLVGMKE